MVSGDRAAGRRKDSPYVSAKVEQAMLPEPTLGHL
jgi:hypothetical protein